MHAPGEVGRRDVAVLVHGLAAGKFVMRALAGSLAKASLKVVNWGYRSLWSPLQRQGRQLAGILSRLEEEEPNARVHLVTHSMGGIIARLALAEYLPRRLGRFVMIAPPNRGSHIAAWLAP